MRKLLLLPAVLVVGAPLALLLMSSATVLKMDPPVRVIGKKTPIKVRVENPHGIRRMTAALEQDGARYVVFEKTEPSNRTTFWRKHEPPREISFTAGQEAAPKLKDGKARLIVQTVSNDLQGRTDTIAQDVDVNTRPLSLTVDGFQHYINQGGAELVVFTVSGYWTEAGVRVGPYTFRSFPMPGRANSDPSQSERFCLFGFPWDVPANTTPVVYARNPSGAEVTGTFWYKLFPKKFRERQLDLPESFLNKVVNELDPGGAGDLLSRFLKINGEMRRQNNKALADLRLKTEERVLWKGPFVQLGNSQVEALFADTRDYMYQGKKVDRQTHLGFDLSVVKNVSVVSSNDGKVVYAAPLGIYGNCVVVDHGYGLQSIYAHLSAIGVKPGDAVTKGREIGKSGATGLAGGDHLHFSLQLDGVQINPVEWWDSHWIDDRILSKLPAGS